MSLAKFLAKMAAEHGGSAHKLLGEAPMAEKIVGLSPLGYAAGGAALLGGGALAHHLLQHEDGDEDMAERHRGGM